MVPDLPSRHLVACLSQNPNVNLHFRYFKQIIIYNTLHYCLVVVSHDPSIHPIFFLFIQYKHLVQVLILSLSSFPSPFLILSLPHILLDSYRVIHRENKRIGELENCYYWKRMKWYHCWPDLDQTRQGERGRSSRWSSASVSWSRWVSWWWPTSVSFATPRCAIFIIIMGLAMHKQ